jgi:hypothetical protein
MCNEEAEMMELAPSTSFLPVVSAVSLGIFLESVSGNIRVCSLF